MTRYKKMIKDRYRKQIIESIIDTRQTTSTNMDQVMMMTERAIRYHFVIIGASNAISHDNTATHKLDWKTRSDLHDTLSYAIKTKYQSMITVRNILKTLKDKDPLPLPG